jgi:hypothetical protein
MVNSPAIESVARRYRVANRATATLRRNEIYVGFTGQSVSTHRPPIVVVLAALTLTTRGLRAANFGA